MKLRNPLFPAGIVLLITLLPGCIERDNWWDPENGCHPIEELPQYRDSVEQAIEKIITGVAYTDIDIDKLNEEFLNQKTTNDENALNNTTTLIIINGLLKNNRDIDSVNRSVPTDSTQNKNPIAQRLQPMQRAHTTPQGRITLDLARDSVEYWIGAARAFCPKQTVLTSHYIDSTRKYLAVRTDRWGRELENIYSYNSRMSDSNRVIDSINTLAHFQDSLVAIYNDSLRFCKIPQVVDPLEILRQIDSILPGKNIALAADSVAIANFRLINKRGAGTWTGIEGIPGRKTVVRPGTGTAEIKASSYIRFVNIVFLGNGKGPAVRVTDQSDSIVFSKCEFTGAGTYGVDALTCNTITFEDCIFRRNGEAKGEVAEQAGLRLSECRGTISFVNVLIAQNLGYGIDINKSNVNAQHGTIAGNSLDGIRFTGPNGTGSFYAKSVLFAFNGGYGIYRNDENVTRDIWAAEENNNYFSGNDSGAMGGNPKIITANGPFTDPDPMFVNSDGGDYRIGPSSRLFENGTGYCFP